MPCLSVTHTERCSGLHQASDEARRDVTSVSSVDAFSEPVQTNCSQFVSHSMRLPFKLLAGPGLARRQALRTWLSAHSLLLPLPSPLSSLLGWE